MEVEKMERYNPELYVWIFPTTSIIGDKTALANNDMGHKIITGTGPSTMIHVCIDDKKLYSKALSLARKNHVNMTIASKTS